MNLRRILRWAGLALLLLLEAWPATAEELTNALQAFLQQRVEVEQREPGLVVGLVDEQGPRVVSCGRLDNGSGQPLDGDTLFEVGSITKTFTALLLQDMVERGEMRLEDPVANYLPPSVRMPSRNGKPITLQHLATHTSGLPLLPYNLDPRRADDPYADYTVEKLYAFLSDYQLSAAPGSKYQYSELGMELLGHVIARKAGTNYEALVMERICRPLGMDSTRVTLTPELKARLARGHDQLGHAFPGLHFQSLVGGSGLHSTANDLLKFLAANLGLASCRLTPLMEKNHRVQYESVTKNVRMGMGWMAVRFPQDTEFLIHGGATPGFTTFMALDRAHRRGVVVLAPADDRPDPFHLGMFLLKSEWRPERRPAAARLDPVACDAYVGEYRLSPDMAVGMLGLRAVLATLNKTALGIAAGAGLAGLLLLLLLLRVPIVRRLRNRLGGRWCGWSSRTRWMARGGAVLVGVGAAIAAPLVVAHVVWAWTHAVVDIRRQGDRLFAQCTGMAQTANKLPLPRLTGELVPGCARPGTASRGGDGLVPATRIQQHPAGTRPSPPPGAAPESSTRFFERVSGMPITFSTDARGKVIRLRALFFGAELTFVKTADHVPDPPRPLVPVQLDPKLCDACVGEYEFAPDKVFPDGVKLTLRRQGDGLAGEAADKHGGYGAFEVYPLSETNFFFNMTVVGVQLHFVKNELGEVTSVTRHVGWLPDCAGKKLGDAKK